MKKIWLSFLITITLCLSFGLTSTAPAHAADPQFIANPIAGGIQSPIGSSRCTPLIRPVFLGQVGSGTFANNSVAGIPICLMGVLQN